MKPNWYFEKHEKLWSWLECHPGAFKREWPGWADIKENILNDCFLCEYFKKDCAACFFSAASSDSFAGCKELFHKWNETTAEHRDLLAKQKILAWKIKKSAKAISAIASRIKNLINEGKNERR